MDLASNAVTLLRNNPTVRAWSKMSDIVSVDGTPISWEFPAIICHAIGEEPEITIPAMAALGSLQLAIILIDDMLDEDPRGQYHEIGTGRAANLASAFQALGLDMIEQATLHASQKQQAIALLNNMVINTAHGQALDIQNPKDEASYWAMVRAKSSPYYGASFALGAVFSNSKPDLIRKIDSLGRLYGEMIQIHDDTKDSLERPINPDWVQGRFPLPILYATLVDHPKRDEFKTLHAYLSSESGAADEVALKQAQDILVSCGAIAYCMDQLVERYTLAQKLLKEIEVKNPTYLIKLIEELIDPLRNILDDLQATAPELTVAY